MKTIILQCPECQETFSTDLSDYWDRADEYVFTCYHSDEVEIPCDLILKETAGTGSAPNENGRATKWQTTTTYTLLSDEPTMADLRKAHADLAAKSKA